MARKIVCAPATISKILNDGRGIGRGLAESINRHYGVSIEWLRFGKGEMFTGKEPDHTSSPQDILYEMEESPEFKSGMASDSITDEEFEELRDLLWKAKDVLLSKTHYAQSLAANIRSFHMGVELDQDLKHRVAALEKNRGNIRGNDPPEKKDELLKMRTG